MKKWEVKPVNLQTGIKPYDVGILLGGSLRSYDQEFGRPVYSQSVDRLLQTIALYKSGKVKKILLSGGSGSVTRPNERESEIILKVLLQTGIPENDIIIENTSRNTYENAIYTAEILKKRDQEKITSLDFLVEKNILTNSDKQKLEPYIRYE